MARALLDRSTSMTTQPMLTRSSRIALTDSSPNDVAQTFVDPVMDPAVRPASDSGAILPSEWTALAATAAGLIGIRAADGGSAARTAPSSS